MSLANPGGQFTPLRPASRRGRVLLFLFGPVVWVIALVVLAYVTDRRNAVEFAAIIFAASFLISLLLLGVARILRIREEREP